MNPSRKKYNRFSNFPGQPHFHTVRVRQNLGRKVNQTKSVTAKEQHLSIHGAFKFPTARRSNKSEDTSSGQSDFSLKTFKTSFASKANTDGSILSLLKNMSSTSSKSNVASGRLLSGSKSTSTVDNFFSPGLQNSCRTPANTETPFMKQFSAVKKFCLFSSTSTNDSQFFATPRKRNASRTPKSSSSAISDPLNNVVIAVTEGRGHARGEVGIAAIDVKRPFLTLCEISDTQTYINTLSKINVLNPIEILVPNTFYDNPSSTKLYQIISENFPNSAISTVQRKFFNENSGLQQIQSICLPEYSSVLLMIPRKFYALAAAAAILKYAEFEQNITFPPRSIRVNYESGNNITFIDLETSQKLELVNSQNKGNICPENTLFGVLNNCNTMSGQRRLRSVILQPSCDETEINKRLDCVEELIQNPELLFSLKTILPKFWDIEQLLSLSTQIANFKDSSKAVELQINYVLLLKTSLEAIPLLQKSLENTKANFFSSLRQNLDNVQYKKMLDKIYEIINDDAHLSQKFDVCQFQRCFCIKTGIDAFLDVARLAYTELVQDFNGVVDDLVKEYQLPLTIRTLKNKGPVLQMKLNGLNDNYNLRDLPSVFIQAEKSRSTITMTTRELLFLKERMNHFIQEIQLLSSVVIFDMLKHIREYVGSLFILCENIAELDLVASFSQASKSFFFVRPSFSSDCMVLKSSEHPILQRVALSKPVANDVFASIHSNMSVITGPNMGGKSVYIRQIALLQIMAQIGCFVPAESAQFRITDRIFSRIGFNDDMECNASSFIVELKEMHFIMKTRTSRSLIVIDELCRGTSTEEGSALAWAILEELQASTAFIFVTTHFPFLTKLAELYCNVENWHFDTLEIDADPKNSPSLVYTHRLVPGIMKLEHYGLKLARITAIPDHVLQSSEIIMQKLNAEWKGISTLEGNIHDDKKIDLIFVKLLGILDNQGLTISCVKDIVEHTIDLQLNFDEDYQEHSENEMNGNHNFNSSLLLTESESFFEDDVCENTRLSVSVVEENDEMLSEKSISRQDNFHSEDSRKCQTERISKSFPFDNDNYLSCDELHNAESRLRSSYDSDSEVNFQVREDNENLDNQHSHQKFDEVNFTGSESYEIIQEGNSNNKSLYINSNCKGTLNMKSSKKITFSRSQTTDLLCEGSSNVLGEHSNCIRFHSV